MQALIDATDRIPVATLIHVLAVVIAGVYLVVHGHLDHDVLVYLGIAEGGNGLVGVSRAHLKGQQAAADAHRFAAAASLDGGSLSGLTQGARHPDAYDEPQD